MYAVCSHANWHWCVSFACTKNWSGNTQIKSAGIKNPNSNYIPENFVLFDYRYNKSNNSSFIKHFILKCHKFMLSTFQSIEFYCLSLNVTFTFGSFWCSRTASVLRVSLFTRIKKLWSPEEKINNPIIMPSLVNICTHFIANRTGSEWLRPIMIKIQEDRLKLKQEGNLSVSHTHSSTCIRQVCLLRYGGW